MLLVCVHVSVPFFRLAFISQILVCLSCALGIAIAMRKQICQAVCWYVTLSKYCTCQLAGSI